MKFFGKFFGSLLQGITFESTLLKVCVWPIYTRDRYQFLVFCKGNLWRYDCPTLGRANTRLYHRLDVSSMGWLLNKKRQWLTSPAQRAAGWSTYICLSACQLVPLSPSSPSCSFCFPSCFSLLLEGHEDVVFHFTAGPKLVTSTNSSVGAGTGRPKVACWRWIWCGDCHVPLNAKISSKMIFCRSYLYVYQEPTVVQIYNFVWLLFYKHGNRRDR